MGRAKGVAERQCLLPGRENQPVIIILGELACKS